MLIIYKGNNYRIITAKTEEKLILKIFTSHLLSLSDVTYTKMW